MIEMKIEITKVHGGVKVECLECGWGVIRNEVSVAMENLELHFVNHKQIQKFWSVEEMTEQEQYQQILERVQKANAALRNTGLVINSPEWVAAQAELKEANYENHKFLAGK